MNARVETITPAIAQEYLKKNCDNNRRLQETRVKSYAETMKRGAWQTNGEAIVFNENGILVNGQHRLAAIVKSGVAVDMVIIRGVKKDVTLFDRGQMRNTAQSLLMGGFDKELVNNTTCAVAKMYLTIKNGNKRFHTDDEIEDFLVAYDDIVRKAYHIGVRHMKDGKRIVNTAHACIITALFSAIKAGEKEEDLDAFCRILASGLYDYKYQTAAVVCRNDIISKAIDMSRGGNTRTIAVAQIEKAIYDFCKKTPRTRTYKSHTEFIY